jgi:hypothetical protein
VPDVRERVSCPALESYGDPHKLIRRRFSGSIDATLTRRELFGCNRDRPVNPVVDEFRWTAGLGTTPMRTGRRADATTHMPTTLRIHRRTV